MIFYGAIRSIKEGAFDSVVVTRRVAERKDRTDRSPSDLDMGGGDGRRNSIT